MKGGDYLELNQSMGGRSGLQLSFFNNNNKNNNTLNNII